MAIGIAQKESANKKALATRIYSKNQEHKVAQKINGTLTPNSGATPWIKGDILTEDFVIECKTKIKPSQSITIKKEWIEKNKQEALFMGKEHQAIAFNFGPDEENHYIIDEYLFKTLIEYLQGENQNEDI